MTAATYSIRTDSSWYRCVRSALTRCILASGLSLEDRNAVRSILDEDGRDQGQGESTPLVVFTPEIAQKRVGDVLTDAPMIGLLQVYIILHAIHTWYYSGCIVSLWFCCRLLHSVVHRCSSSLPW